MIIANRLLLVALLIDYLWLLGDINTHIIAATEAYFCMFDVGINDLSMIILTKYIAS